MSQDIIPPKPRKENKKNQNVKSAGLNGKYSAKHSRIRENKPNPKN